MGLAGNLQLFGVDLHLDSPTMLIGSGQILILLWIWGVVRLKNAEIATAHARIKTLESRELRFQILSKMNAAIGKASEIKRDADLALQGARVKDGLDLSAEFGKWKTESYDGIGEYSAQLAMDFLGMVSAADPVIQSGGTAAMHAISDLMPPAIKRLNEYKVELTKPA